VHETKDEAAIRELVEGWAEAVRDKDLSGILRNHAHDMVMFDVPPPLQLQGIEEYGKSWDLFYAASPEPFAFDIREMKVTAGQDVAFAVAVMHCRVKEGRDASDLDFRLTIGLRKIEGQWLITHEHHSVPATT
jgi:uncharacterized protein (TIGR02246 family)